MRWVRDIVPIWVFLILVFVLSWPFLIYGFGWFGSREAILTRYLFACTGMLMVAVSAFITRRTTDGQTITVDGSVGTVELKLGGC